MASDLLDLVRVYTRKVALQESKVKVIRSSLSIIEVLLKLKYWQAVERLQHYFTKRENEFMSVSVLLEHDQISLAESLLPYINRFGQGSALRDIGQWYVKKGFPDQGILYLRRAFAADSEETDILTKMALAGYISESIALTKQLFPRQLSYTVDWDGGKVFLPEDEIARHKILEALIEIDHIDNIQSIMEHFYEPVSKILAAWNLAYKHPEYIDAARLVAAFLTIPEREQYASPVVGMLLLKGEKRQAVQIAQQYSDHIILRLAALLLVQNRQLEDILSLMNEIGHDFKAWPSIIYALTEQSEFQQAESYLAKITDKDQHSIAVTYIIKALLQTDSLDKAEIYYQSLPDSLYYKPTLQVELAYSRAKKSVEFAKDALRLVIQPEHLLTEERRKEIRQYLTQMLLAADRAQEFFNIMQDKSLVGYIDYLCELALATDQPLQVILAMLQTLAEFTSEWQTFYLEFKAAIDG